MRNVNNSGHEGSMLVGLAVALFLVAMLTAALLLLSGIGSSASVEQVNASAAFSAAESGLSVGRAYITTNASWLSGLPVTFSGSVDRASYAVTVSSTGGYTAALSSTGQRGQSRWTSQWGATGTGAASGTGTAVRGMVTYRDAVASTTYPRSRAYSHLKLLCGETLAATVSGDPGWQKIAASPRTNEYLLVVQNSSRQVWAQTWTNGVWSTPRLMNAAGAPFTQNRGFDVAYESSGRAIVVYSTGVSTPRYQIWNGTNWSAEATISTLPSTTAIRWVRLVPKPGGNEMLLMVRWVSGSTDRSAAILWDGVSSWVYPTVVLESNNHPSPDCEPMDCFFAGNTPMVLYVNNTTTPRYRTLSGGVWSAASTFGSLGGGVPYWIRVHANTNGTAAFAAFAYDGGSGVPRLKGCFWNGATWGAYTNFTAATPLSTLTERAFDIAWSQKTNVLMTTYALRSQTNHSFMAQVYPGGAATFGSMASGTDSGRWSRVEADPFYNEFIYGALDNAGDANFQRWSGTNWVKLMEATQQSSYLYDSIHISFRQDRLVP